MSDNQNATETNATATDTTAEKPKDERKQSLYFPIALVGELKEEAARLDRSLSWLVAKCVRLALPQIKKMESMSDDSDDES